MRKGTDPARTTARYDRKVKSSLMEKNSHEHPSASEAIDKLEEDQLEQLERQLMSENQAPSQH